MKNVLVIHYSQSGQLTQIARKLLSPLVNEKDIHVYFEAIKPKKPYPFPWTINRFFDIMPDCVFGVPIELEPFTFDPQIDWDLIVIAYQVWYLSPSIPINSFLHSPEAAKVLDGKPVVTIIGCRNMWLTAQEKMKTRLMVRNARLIGNIVMRDRAGNLTSMITILHWMLSGKQEPFWIFPKAGVSQKDVEESKKFGFLILDALNTQRTEGLQQRLNQAGAVEIDPGLMILENRGKKAFPIWARFIGTKHKGNTAGRKFRLLLFMFALPTAIIILSPITITLTFLTKLLRKKHLEKDIAYYSQNALRG